ncbi:MAG: pyruvate kinase [Candidatus Anoxymicrobium japonicum]|uniref:Pyruvate kinase n=1 Tax=Candidatus Anoxymicrobium japonicum TaxID=2013648 RepID=A0A2N3G5L3_9ACTN|nr:MAG: pyruvate kinase [Candidatus Anoxymicrobium japonicum]
MAGETCGIKSIRAKIICTIGPSSNSTEILRHMIGAGMDVARINTGHADIEEVRRYIHVLKKASESSNRRVGILLDLQGPRLRVGPIKGSHLELEAGQRFTITTSQRRGDETCVSIAYTGLTQNVKPGERIFIDDGLVQLVVRDISGNDVNCEVVEGGKLSRGKGMNFPDSNLSLASFTERDRRYLEAGLEAGVDWVAQSFVRSPGDIAQVVDAVHDLGYQVPVMAKIEKREGMANIDAILDAAQGIMIARGDLGVELPIEDVPLIQKELINKAVRAALPVVTATQMLESMVDEPRPTRAEASDVANAILDGTDAIMLSAETAIGQFPVQAVEMMARIASRTEQAVDYDRALEERARRAHRNTADAIGYAACKVAADLGAKAIVTITRGGYTARLVARYRPRAPIIAISPSEEVINSMSLVWGVQGVVAPMAIDVATMIKNASGACVLKGLLRAGDLIVVTGGFLDEESGKTNMIHTHTVAE